MKVLTTIAVALLPVAAMAQVPNPPQSDPAASPQATFESLDRNKDQRLSKVEATADDGLASQFAALDSDADGYINKGEYLRMRQRRVPSPEEDLPAPDPQS